MSGGSRHAAAQQERLAGLLEPVISAAGLELESIRVSRAGRRALLRIVIDGDSGVSLDDIARVSRVVGERIDSSDAMGAGPYTLEVSSPGVDRPLTEPRHWRRAVGRLARAAIAGQPDTIEGRIVSADESAVVLETDGERRTIGYADLGPGQVQVEFDGHGALADTRLKDAELARGVAKDGH
jgi:ribosome maturation factor RimP